MDALRPVLEAVGITDLQQLEQGDGPAHRRGEELTERMAHLVQLTFDQAKMLAAPLMHRHADEVALRGRGLSAFQLEQLAAWRRLGRAGVRLRKREREVRALQVEKEELERKIEAAGARRWAALTAKYEVMERCMPKLDDMLRRRLIALDRADVAYELFLGGLTTFASVVAVGWQDLKMHYSSLTVPQAYRLAHATHDHLRVIVAGLTERSSLQELKQGVRAAGLEGVITSTSRVTILRQLRERILTVPGRSFDLEDWE